MNSLEDRLRSAYAEAAATVAPPSVRALPSPAPDPGLAADRGPGRDLGQALDLGPAVRPGWRRGPARRSGRRGPAGPLGPRRLGTALTAAAAAAAIAVAASVAATHIGRGQPHQPGQPAALSTTLGHAQAAGQSAVFGAGRVPQAVPPRYFVEIKYLDQPANEDDVTTLNVYDAATGHLTGTLRSPRPHVYFQAVAPLGSDRTFVAAAESYQVHGKGRACGSWLYRFRLSPQGRPTGVTPLGSRLAGFIATDSLAGSADGSTVAYDSVNCSQTRQGIVRDYGHIGVLRVRSGITKNWIYKFPATPTSLSLSADGRLLGMVSNPSNGTRESSSQFNSAWILRTSAPQGQLGRHYRQVIGRALAPLSAVLNPAGTVMTAALPHYLVHQQKWVVTLGTARTAVRGPVTVLRVLPAIGTLNEELALSPDVSGRYLLLSQWNNRIQRIDAATGRVITLPNIHDTSPWGVAW
jgi:hypothetical protein